MVGVERTLLGPLFARAHEATKPLPLIRDPHAVELARLLAGELGSVPRPRIGFGPVLRTWMIDAQVTEFLRQHPTGTVVELGAGLNTRFERLDNGLQRWFDLDLPRVSELRERLLRPSSRRVHISASIDETTWLPRIVGRPPYLFVLEAVLAYLRADAIHGLFTAIAALASAADLVVDMPRRVALGAGFWAYDRPRELERTNRGWRLIDTTRMLDAQSLRANQTVERVADLRDTRLAGYQLARLTTRTPT